MAIRDHGLARLRFANAGFLCFHARPASTPHETHLARRFPRPRRNRQLLPRGRPPRHDAARVQPAHPGARVVDRRAALRPRQPARHAHRGGRLVPDHRAGDPRPRRARARGGAWGRRRQCRHAALRRDARAFAHLPADVAAQPRVERRAGPHPAHLRRRGALRGADARPARAVHLVPRPLPRAAPAPKPRPPRPSGRPPATPDAAADESGNIAA